jgi:hypothetical protein
MGKQTEWKNQSRKEISDLAAAHAKSPFSDAGRLALSSMSVPIDELPTGTMIQLIKAGAASIAPSYHNPFKIWLRKDPALARQALNLAPDLGEARVLATVGRMSKEQVRNILKDGTNLVPEHDHRSLAEFAIADILETETAELPGRVRTTAVSYLKKRKIIRLKDEEWDADEGALTIATQKYMDAHNVGSLLTGLYMMAIEDLYIRAKKMLRTCDLMRSEAINSLARQLYEKQDFTGPQVASIRKFVARELDKLYESKLVAARAQEGRIIFPSIGFVSAAISELGKKLIETDVRGDFARQFKQTGKKAVVPTAPVHPSQTKLGSKDERVAAHCLGVIESAHNADIAQAFRRLLDTGVITTRALNSVSEGGAVTQMVFLRAVEKHDFTTHFGPNRVDHLARGLAFIGKNGGRTREAAQREFGSAEAGQILDFLQANGLITDSPGGKLIRLEKPAY